MLRLALPLAAAMLGCACVSRRPLLSHAIDDVGIIPAGDVLEIGLDRSGEVEVLELHTTLDHLPPAVRSAAEAALPGARIVSCEKEYEGGELYWEVEASVGGLKKEILFRSDGSVVASEIEVARSSAPAAVLSHVEGAVPGGLLQSVEEVRRGNRLTYHVKTEKDGIRYKLILDPDGRLVRALREVPAEVEVPVTIVRAR